MNPSSRKITIDSGGDTNSNNDSSQSVSRNNNGRQSVFRGRLPSIPREIDVFGFALEPKQFIIVLLLATLMLGPSGSLIFLIILGLYTSFQNFSIFSSFRRGLGGSSTTTGGRRPGVQFGANIKGVKDLPKPPQGG